MFNFTKRKTTKSKMGNTKVTIDGIKFDSKLEAKFYVAIKYHKECKIEVLPSGQGILTNLEMQPDYLKLIYIDRQNKVELLPKSNKVRAVHYIPDFQIMYNNKVYNIDAKGRETDVFKLKMNLYKRLKDIPDLIVAKTVDDMIQDLKKNNK